MAFAAFRFVWPYQRPVNPAASFCRGRPRVRAPAVAGGSSIVVVVGDVVCCEFGGRISAASWSGTPPSPGPSAFSNRQNSVTKQRTSMHFPVDLRCFVKIVEKFSAQLPPILLCCGAAGQRSRTTGPQPPQSAPVRPPPGPTVPLSTATCSGRAQPSLGRLPAARSYQTLP